MIHDLHLFAELSPDDSRLLTAHCITRSYPKNTVLVNEGDETDALYVIRAGKVKVFVSDEAGREVILNILGPDEYFGELAIVDNSPRSASVMTLEECRLSVISGADFRQCMTAHPHMAMSIIRAMAQRIRSLTDNVRSLALMDVYGRVARTLLDLAKEKDGKLVIEQRLTHQDIANMVGASREMVCRILKDLTVGHYISISKGKIRIDDKLPPHW